MRRQLAQTRPSDTLAASALTGALYDVDLIIVTSTTANDTVFSIYHDDDGSTYSEATALYYQAPISSKDVAYVAFEVPIPLSNIAGNLAVQSGEASGITFTIYGEKKGEAL